MAMALRRTAVWSALTRRLRFQGSTRLFSDNKDLDEVEEVEVPLEDHVETEEEEHHEEPPPLTEVKYAKKSPNITPFDSFGPGIYKAITLGNVGQAPVQKFFTNGSSVVIFSLGTGGLRNNRKQFDGEAAEAYAERSFTQWHRVCIFKTGLQEIASKLKRGSQVYVEGNIETRVFTDPVTGLLKRFREICVRQTGRLYIINN